MKYTLLQIVQNMLGSIGAESVSATSDTPEALLCVDLANIVYERIIYLYPWRHLQTGRGALSAGTYKNELKGPSNTIRIEDSTVWYGATEGQKVLVKYQEPDDFIAAQVNLKPSLTNIETVNGINVFNDRNPTYFTSFDGETYTFNNIPTTAGLVTGDSYAMYSVGPSARVTTGASTFNLPAQVYPFFRDLCVELAFLVLKNDVNKANIEETQAIKGLHKVLVEFPKLLLTKRQISYYNGVRT